MEPNIIFEDEDLVVIVKPAGMVTNVSQTSRGNTVQQWFVNRLKAQNLEFGNDGEFFQKQGIVHRLDKDTSGLLVLAKNEKAYENLKRQFLERKVSKKYTALVHGAMKQEKGIISLPIVRHPKIWGKFTTGDDLSRTAITEWEIIKRLVIRDLPFTLVELIPLTGRTHQLRVHLKHLGHPIASDPIYLSRKELERDLTWCPRLFLHAGFLEFLHPISQKKCEFDSELPDELRDTLIV